MDSNQIYITLAKTLQVTIQYEVKSSVEIKLENLKKKKVGWYLLAHAGWHQTSTTKPSHILCGKKIMWVYISATDPVILFLTVFGKNLRFPECRSSGSNSCQEKVSRIKMWISHTVKHALKCIISINDGFTLCVWTTSLTAKHQDTKIRWHCYKRLLDLWLSDD